MTEPQPQPPLWASWGGGDVALGEAFALPFETLRCVVGSPAAIPPFLAAAEQTGRLRREADAYYGVCAAVRGEQKLPAPAPASASAREADPPVAAASAASDYDSVAFSCSRALENELALSARLSPAPSPSPSPAPAPGAGAGADDGDDADTESDPPVLERSFPIDKYVRSPAQRSSEGYEAYVQTEDIENGAGSDSPPRAEEEAVTILPFSPLLEH